MAILEGDQVRASMGDWRRLFVIGIDFISSLLVCSPQALLRSQASADLYGSRFAIGSDYLDQICFTNGQWYTQVFGHLPCGLYLVFIWVYFLFLHTRILLHLIPALYFNLSGGGPTEPD